MTEKEKIRAEIERIRKSYQIKYQELDYTSPELMSVCAKRNLCQDILMFIDSMQEEPKECMYSTANFTNADRLTLCKDCEELCKYNQKTAAESLGISQEVYDEIVDKCLYGSEVELVNNGDLPKEEFVSDDLEEAIDTYLATYFGGEKEKQNWPFLKKMAMYFANWQKQQMMKDTICTYMSEDDCGDIVPVLANQDRFKVGDKVKVIIIKED